MWYKLLYYKILKYDYIYDKSIIVIYRIGKNEKSFSLMLTFTKFVL